MVGKYTVQIACDIGGTFTDLVAQVSDGQAHVRKVPSTPALPGAAVVTGLRQLLDDLNLAFSDITEVVHGTTVGSNIILQKRGGKTGLITTTGFRDVLEIGRIRTPTMFDVAWDKPSPLVPRRYRVEVAERMAANGEVVVPLDEESVIAAGSRLVKEGVETAAVCFLHSCINSEHERRAQALLRSAFPQLRVTASCDVLPEIKEYERTSTTVVNAYLLPGMQRYLESLAIELADAGMDAPILVIASSGGMMKIETAMEKPVFAVGSGPAGGVIGSMRLGREIDCLDAIAFDMGGTTAKASIIESGDVTITSEYEFRDGMSTPSRFIKGGGYMLKVPAIDIAEVGAGGGSIAWIDEGGLLQVGPISAGAEPGPVCYGLGNERPTVTDANVALGILNQDSLAGGSVLINAVSATTAIRRHIAEPLDLSLIEAAAGIRQIVNVAMARAIRSVTIERGRDPRHMTLFAFGGSGPAHAVDVAALLGISKVVIPVMSGVFSAVGMLGADVEHNFVENLFQPLDRIKASELMDVIERLRESGTERLQKDGFGEVDRQLQFSADLHYFGQSSELNVAFNPEDIEHGGLGSLSKAFHAAYLETYGYQNNEPVELVNIRLSAFGIRRHRVAFAEGKSGVTSGEVPESFRNVWFDSTRELISTVVYPRSAIERTEVRGPAILESYDTTIVVPPGCGAVTDKCGSVVISVPSELVGDTP